jgi:predicted XRE-type DNA-binding protein
MADKVQPSSGNVFSDLGFTAGKAENLKIRSDLMIELTKLIEAQGLTKAAAARLLGVTQPRVSDLFRGKIVDCCYAWSCRRSGLLRALLNMEWVAERLRAGKRQGTGGLWKARKAPHHRPSAGFPLLPQARLRRQKGLARSAYKKRDPQLVANSFPYLPLRLSAYPHLLMESPPSSSSPVAGSHNEDPEG